MSKSSFGKAAIAALIALTLAGCGDKSEKAPAKNDLALPVTAPMQARERLLTEMKKQKDAARARNEQFEQALGK